MNDAARFFHREWLGMAQPIEGLVFSVPALIESECFQRLAAEDHRDFIAQLEQTDANDSETNAAELAADGARPLRLRDPRDFFCEGLGWNNAGYTEELPDALSLYIPEGGQTLRPTAALKIPDYAQRPQDLRISSPPSYPPAAELRQQYRLLYWELPDGLDLDAPEDQSGPWLYPPTHKFDRLLRHCRIPIGVLCNGSIIRLIYAPHGGASGHLDFRIAHMAQVHGRPLFDALVMLLSDVRIASVAEDKQLHSILARSRQMQAEVTTDLSRQMLQALETLLHAFEAADERAHHCWLRPIIESRTEHDDPLYEALLTFLLRLVVILYAEDKNLLPSAHPLFAEHYSLFALFERLQTERGRYPDAMHRRYSAYPGLLALFRAIYFGIEHEDLRIAEHKGQLFDPNRFAFLEGFSQDASVPVGDPEARARATLPTIDDESIYQILRALIFLDGERLSYKSLEVEQIGSCYEALMGFSAERLIEDAVRIKPSSSGFTPSWLSVSELLEVKASQRKNFLKEHVGLSGARAAALHKDIAALEKEHATDRKTLLEKATLRLSEESTKHTPIAKKGSLIIQPGEERKRTSSHYTPPELSRPLVARALEPLLKAFAEPSSEQILSLSLCDPAMGSGAFLVEATRYLSEQLLFAWQRENHPITQSKGKEDLILEARRLVAERCIYGVDKNPFAVELAKISLWLLTMQRQKPFSFVDHNLRCGDSLVGLSFEQIISFNWQPETQQNLISSELKNMLDEAIEARLRITQSAEQFNLSYKDKSDAMRDADDALYRLRLIANLLIGAFFDHKKSKERESERTRRLDLIITWLAEGEGCREAYQEIKALSADIEQRINPFHWHLEYPEIFYAGRVDPLSQTQSNEPAYLDCVVGNPPFMGQSQISARFGDSYRDWLFLIHPGALGKSDIVAHFFRRADTLLGEHGTIGLVSTNTISQGDTRRSSLKVLIGEGSVVFNALVSTPWPGDAAVTISTVHLAKGEPKAFMGAPILDAAQVSVINSRLLAAPERPDPVKLADNAESSFLGVKVYGQGFVLTPEERDALIQKDARNAERIFPYLGGQEVNTSPTQAFDRYVINFGQMSLEQAEAWPDLLQIIRDKVKPERDKLRDNSDGKQLKTYWWQFGRVGPGLYAAIAPLQRCLVNSQVSKHLILAFQPIERVFSHALNVFALENYTAFAILQSRIHEPWARLMGSTLEDRLRYTASDCFETFPFPKADPHETFPELEALGKELYEARTDWMNKQGQGLTKLYNALKDEALTNDPTITRLRHLHEHLDHEVLQTYATQTGDPTWTTTTIPPYNQPNEKIFETHTLDHLFALNEQRARR
ncbi:MAG: N-6 DNA methylase [Myxococcales bacterium]|nr:MAG: N-6 DNA methylase [Myxococcales bacterium]